MCGVVNQNFHAAFAKVFICVFIGIVRRKHKHMITINSNQMIWRDNGVKSVYLCYTQFYRHAIANCVGQAGNVPLINK